MSSIRMELLQKLKNIIAELEEDNISSKETSVLEDKQEHIQWQLAQFESIMSMGIGEQYAGANLSDLDNPQQNKMNTFLHKFKITGSEQYEIDKTEEIDLFKFFGEFVDNYVDPSQYGTSIIITGPIGSGKTHASIALMLLIHNLHTTTKLNLECGDFVKVKLDTRFVQIHDLLSSIASRDYRSDDEVNKIRKSDILIIDDLGAEQGAPDWLIQQFIHRIIKFRDSNNKTTIFTSNLGPEDFCKVYGQRASSVIFGNNYKHITIKSEKSWRLIDE